MEASEMVSRSLNIPIQKIISWIKNNKIRVRRIEGGFLLNAICPDAQEEITRAHILTIGRGN